MGGKVGVDSEIDVGSEFWFKANFPIAVKEPIDHENIGDDLAAYEKIFQWAHLKVLIVEDNLVNQQVALGLFRYLGVECMIAQNGGEALEMINMERFDAIFMDCMMPVMDGFETTRRIRQLEKGKEMPIIAMTAGALAGGRQASLDAGMNDYLSKPFQHEDLIRLLKKYIKKIG